MLFYTCTYSYIAHIIASMIDNIFAYLVLYIAKRQIKLKQTNPSLCPAGDKCVDCQCKSPLPPGCDCDPGDCDCDMRIYERI